jgi:hypothetical protein
MRTRKGRYVIEFSRLEVYVRLLRVLQLQLSLALLNILCVMPRVGTDFREAVDISSLFPSIGLSPCILRLRVFALDEKKQYGAVIWDLPVCL